MKKNPLNVLVIDTSGPRLKIALAYKGKVFEKIGELSEKKHLSTVLPALDGLLSLAGANLLDMDYLSAVVGPGSFTGVRIGVNLINSFRLATGKPAVGITAFDVMAQEKKQKNAVYLVDARHGNFYAGIYLDKSREYKNLTTEELSAYKYSTVLYSDNRIPARAMIKAAIAAVPFSKGDSLSPFYMKASSAEREADKSAE